VKRVFLDASALVPMAAEWDQWRPRFQEALLHLRRSGPVDLITTNWTLYEALAVAQRRGKRSALNLFRLASSGVEVVPVTEAVEAEALRRFLAWHDKTASVVDHANALVASEEGCDAIISFDADFVPLATAAGMRLLS
jgi:predicted nucleic acid-binding protein